eukprot:5599088-Pyramimonas_sp.AAC.2
MHVAGSSQRGRVEDTAATVDDAIFKLNAYAPIALTKVFTYACLALFPSRQRPCGDARSRQLGRFSTL